MSVLFVVKMEPRDMSVHACLRWSLCRNAGDGLSGESGGFKIGYVNFGLM